jgi:hypothetical protein
MRLTEYLQIKCNRVRPSCEACKVFQCPCIYGMYYSILINVQILHSIGRYSADRMSFSLTILSRRRPQEKRSKNRRSWNASKTSRWSRETITGRKQRHQPYQWESVIYHQAKRKGTFGWTVKFYGRNQLFDPKLSINRGARRPESAVFSRSSRLDTLGPDL